jgi:hypothetical protein
MPVVKKEVRIDNIFRNIGDGLKFIFGKPVLLMPIIFLAVAATFAMNLNVLIPVFSEEVLGQAETGYGFLMSMGGVGALAGALTMAAVSRARQKRLRNVFPMFVASSSPPSASRLSTPGRGGHRVMSFLYMIFRRESIRRSS